LRRSGQRVVSRMAFFTVFAIVKAANIYVVFNRTRVLGVTRVLLASKKKLRIVGKLIPRRFTDEQCNDGKNFAKGTRQNERIPRLRASAEKIVEINVSVIDPREIAIGV